MSVIGIPDVLIHLLSRQGFYINFNSIVVILCLCNIIPFNILNGYTTVKFETS